LIISSIRERYLRLFPLMNTMSTYPKTADQHPHSAKKHHQQTLLLLYRH
jgi:hypothetical protein